MDKEGDLINLTDDTDVYHAISQSNLLKITVFDKTSLTNRPEVGQLADIKAQMIALRDKLSDLILALPTDLNGSGPDQQSRGNEKRNTLRTLTTAELCKSNKI
ncbi:hypothetical protein CLU79DRAFT_754318 [Phycomyces nitens]|nr:hypothetical protein CLU79DRAFT_754318 [Phycomyces nitens]